MNRYTCFSFLGNLYLSCVQWFTIIFLGNLWKNIKLLKEYVILCHVLFIILKPTMFHLWNILTRRIPADIWTLFCQLLWITEGVFRATWWIWRPKHGQGMEYELSCLWRFSLNNDFGTTHMLGGHIELRMSIHPYVCLKMLFLVFLPDNDRKAEIWWNRMAEWLALQTYNH